MEKILLVDDDPLLVLLLKLKLSEAGFEVEEANNGKEALAKIKRKVPDIVLADVKMPQMGGIEFHNQLKMDPDSAKIPVIFISADPDAEKQLGCFRAGTYDFVCKPFRVDHLTDRVRSAIERSGKDNGHESKSAFSGRLAGVGLANIVQFLERNRTSGKLVFRDKKGLKIGVLHFRQGALVNAQTRRFEGKEAFFALWGQKRGTFEFHSRENGFPANIESNNTALLMEAASMDDDYKEMLSRLPRSNPFFTLENKPMPPELIDGFGIEPLYEIVSLIATRTPVKKILQSGNISRIRAGSILGNLLKNNYISIFEQ